MPTLVEIVVNPVSVAVFTLYAALIAWETIAPARPLPTVPGWRIRGLAAFGVYFLLSSYLPSMWGEHLAGLQLIDLTGLGSLTGGAVGLFVYEAGVYVWHRSMHGSTLLWRTFHQMHHSAERLDAFSALWMSPLDMIGWTLLFSLCLSVVGLTPEAATVAMLGSTFLSIFQHTNVSTPRWLGYLIQRPESHSRHHQRGVHAGNYSDVPMFDLLFGTFVNPEEFSRDTGFQDGASARVIDMLRFRDVSTPPSAALAPPR